MPKQRKTKNIVRIVSGGQRGWQVRMMRNGERFHPYFSDSKFGGAKKALAEAVRVRDRIEREYPARPPGGRVDTLLPSNTTGIPGVQIRRAAGPARGKGKPGEERAVAQWCPRPGEVKVRSFSFRKYGRDRALQLAIRARKAGLKQRSP